jgi:hypothetical protein
VLQFFVLIQASKGWMVAFGCQQVGIGIDDPQDREPFLTTDMGYNVKDDFTDVCLDTGYAPVVRYPKHWNTVFPSELPVHTLRGVPAGPVQVAGDFYCPMIREIAGIGSVLRSSRELAAEEKKQRERAAAAGVDPGPSLFEVHDELLAAMLPLSMGKNSRLYRGKSGPGKPKPGDGEDTVRLDQMCPAVQGRVRCRLKPASMDNPDPSVPTLDPPWPEGRYRCCGQSQLTLVLSPEQKKRAQWGLIPGSWEHDNVHGAVRALTEQRFSVMKNQHITGVQDLTWAPRREPLLCVVIALWVAATSMAIQDAHNRGGVKPEPSTRRNWKRLTRKLGHEPTRIPPRT